MRVAAIPLGAPLLTRSSFLPAGETGAPPCIRRCAPAYLELLRVEVTVPSASPQTRCALTAPFHPYLIPACAGPSAVCSLLPCSACHHGWPLAITLPCGVRTFLALSGRNRGGRDCLACFAGADSNIARQSRRLSGAPAGSEDRGVVIEGRVFVRRPPARNAQHRKRREHAPVQFSRRRKRLAHRAVQPSIARGDAP